MRVVNECRVDFKYRLTHDSPLVTRTNFSNVVSTDIVKDMLKIEKFVDKKCTYAFDILTYRIVITNTSNFTATNIFFKDKIPKGTIFIENSVQVDDTKKRCVRPDKGFYINKISYRSSVNIKFRVIVLPLCFIEPITNFSIIQQNYTYNIEKEPVKLNIKSNIVSSNFEKKLFKQLSLDNNIKLKKNISEIINFEANAKILNTKILDSPINKSYKKNKGNMCNLLVIGFIEYKIYFLSASKTNNDINLMKYKFGFSSYLMAPIGIVYINTENIKVNVKYAFVNLINKNLISTSSNIFIYFDGYYNENKKI
ncbi:hypothetical protein GCM10008904_15930 [Paraclostridium ghonii]|uniref:DUF11 domain-containing protein n=1 Tax=Paraclostridium ghonii TaxID=29358 RepID=UPI0027D8EAF8|nr:DUF11 domain-containing protein [Paeniclostridium ghonii]